MFYSNKLEVRNTVFFQDGTYAYYDTGGMLFEQISDEAIYLTTEKVINMIRAYPRYDSPLSCEVLDDGFAWLYCAIDDEELPVATAVFRSSFGEAIKVVSHANGADSAYKSVGEFLEACYEEYIRNVQSFCAFFDALAAEASKKTDEFQSNLAKIFHEIADVLYEIGCVKWSSRCRKASETRTAMLLTSADLFIVRIAVIRFGCVGTTPVISVAVPVSSIVTTSTAHHI